MTPAIHARRGLTLLEVVIALAVFIIAIVPIMHLMTLGGERALDIQQQAHASLLCQGKLDEVKAGVSPLNASGTVVIGNLSWNYTIESTASEVTNLWLVKVSAKLDQGDSKTVEANLTQMVFDPNYRGSSIANTTTSGSSSSSSSTGGGN